MADEQLGLDRPGEVHMTKGNKTGPADSNFIQIFNNLSIRRQQTHFGRRDRISGVELMNVWGSHIKVRDRHTGEQMMLDLMVKSARQ